MIGTSRIVLFSWSRRHIEAARPRPKGRGCEVKAVLWKPNSGGQSMSAFPPNTPPVE
jgi:hypothetical protein